MEQGKDKAGSRMSAAAGLVLHVQESQQIITRHKIQKYR